ncbi:MAG: hypothetical protein R6U66_14705 [Bacteroidales bacterium]
MKFFEMQKRLQCLAEELNKGHTGVANELAKNMGISRSQLFVYIDLLKTYGITVTYCKALNSYVVEEECVIEVQEPIKKIYQK